MTTHVISRMVGTLRRGQERIVGDGRVPCPRSAAGDVEIDRCYSCAHLVEIREDGRGRTVVRCEPRW